MRNNRNSEDDEKRNRNEKYKTMNRRRKGMLEKGRENMKTMAGLRVEDGDNYGEIVGEGWKIMTTIRALRVKGRR